jgi:hypothetical protein
VVPQDDGTARTHVRVQLSQDGEDEVVLTEMDEVIGGVVQRTLPMIPTTVAGSAYHPVFGYDGEALPAELDLCADLPPVDPLYFEMRGTVGGRPAEGRCGFGPGEGGWPPRVRVACGERPFLDGALANVYEDPMAPPPGMTQLLVELRLTGPDQGVTVEPTTLSGVLLGQTTTLPVGAGSGWDVLDLRADDASSGPAFDGNVPAQGRAVFLTLWGQELLGPELCSDSTDMMETPPLLYLSGTGSGSAGPFEFTTAGHSCRRQTFDMDHALP